MINEDIDRSDMFDKDNFIKALIYLKREAFYNNQFALVDILSEAVAQVQLTGEPVLEESNNSEMHMSDLIESFIKLDKKTQNILISALEKAESSPLN